jgi:hypothetical protein
LDIAVDDFGSKPIIRLSIGTKMPPPPTPPTLPNAAPQNPIKVPKTIRHPNSISCIPSNNNNHKLHLLNKIIIISFILKNKHFFLFYT